MSIAGDLSPTYGASYEKRFFYLEETMQQAQCSSNSVADFLEERSLRKLTDPAALVTTLLGFGRFTLYTEVKGLSLLCPNGKQVYTFGHFASRWDLTRLHKTTDWTEGAWLKLQSCASMAHLSAPMFLMLLAYITPPSVARVIQEQCMRKRAALVVWREIPKWLVTCGTVLKEVQKEITAPFEDIDPSTALRKWCTTLPKPNQTWGEFLVHEQALCAQLEPAIAWTVRRDKLLKCLTDCFPYFRDNELSRERHLPHLRKSPGILDFLGDLQKIADSHAPLALDDVLGVAVEPAWSRKNKSLKGKGYASGQSNIHQESLTDNKKPKSDTPIDRSEGKLPAPKQGKPAKKSQGCHKCGDLTHWKRDCPLLVTKAEVKSEAATPDAKPDKQTRSGRTYLVNDGGDLTLGSVYVLNSDSNSDGVLLKAGLDTCSTINLVSSSVLPNLRFTVTKLDDALTVDSIGGQTVLKRMAEVRILTKEGVVTANFFVIHAKALPAGLDLLVGKDTLHRLGYRLVNANVEEPAEELQPPVTACDRDEDPTSWVRPPLSAVLKRFTSPTPTAKPVFDDTLEDMVARGRDFMLQELGVWRVVYGNKNYRCRVRPLEDGEQPEKDCKTQTHVFEFDWLDLPADEKHAKASRNPDFSTGLLKRLGDESRKSFEAEIEKYLDRGWWRPQAEHHDVDTEEKITVFPVEQPTHLSHPVRPCADCRRRNLALPRASYHGLSLGECASVLMASSPKYLRFKDISKAFYRLHLPSWRSVGLQTGGRKFSSRRVVFGLRFGPLALENFTIHLVRSVMMALTGVPPPRLVPEELCSHVEGLVLLAYYDDFAIASNDLKLVELVGLLLDRIGAVFGMVFPAEKAAVVTREPSRHLGLDWWYQDGILHAACPILSEEEWKTEVDNVFNKPGRLTKRSLFRLCGLLLDPLGLHPERELILNKIRSWAGSYGSAVDLPSWDRLLPATQQDKEVLLSLFAQVRQLSSPCSHRSWGGGRVLHALSDASEAGFGWTISTEEGALVAEKCRAFPEGLRWHCNRKEMFSVVDLLKKVVRLVELGLKIDTITLSSDNGSTVAWCNDNVTKVKGFDKIALGRLLNQYREAEEILQTRNISLRLSYPLPYASCPRSRRSSSLMDKD
ncbi:hypothetical protein FOL47_001612 [Perkinsus chesapeaki]|uniref:CCHC-type domain-containing protein n=1 Tax=Perkinsus chesapeaki TaxID=330153 RepID=A0A7J6KSP2_PERCH|nr:hypothetical protein FOL47_001612 [Perkinsus chesapeaki]